MFRLIATTALSLTLCSTALAGGDKPDPHTFGEVAVFAFGGTTEIEQAKTRTGLGPLDAVKQTQQTVQAAKDLTDGTAKAEGSTQAEKVFQTVEVGLEHAFGWQVTDLDTMRDNPAYAEMWDTKTPGINKKLSGWGSGLAPQGVLHKDLSRTVKQPERDALMDALGVEYLAVTSVTISGDDQGVRVGGIGTSRVKPQAFTMVTVYQKGEKKPVWKGSARGKKTDEAIKADFGSQSEDEQAILLQSIEKSMAKLKDKYATG